jgi:hypothetical protein
MIVVSAGILLYVLHYLSKFNPDAEKSAGEKQESSEDYTDPALKEIYGEFIKNGHIDWKGYHNARVESMMKPGFRDDPEWQKQSAEMKEEMRRNIIQAEEEEQEAIIKEMNEKEQTFWQRAR